MLGRPTSPSTAPSATAATASRWRPDAEFVGRAARPYRFRALDRLSLSNEPRRSGRAALLSFVWPGLGQAYAGHRSAAIAYGAPSAAITLVLLLAFFYFGPVVSAAYLLNPPVSLGLITVVALLAVMRAVAVIDAGRVPRYMRTGRSEAVIGLFVVATLLSHFWLGYSLWAFYRAGQLIYEGPPIGVVPTPSPGPGQTPGPGSPSPGASPTPGGPLPGINQRVTILFIGTDNTHGPERGLTDSLIVASFDPVSRSLVMISIPRDTARLPMYNGDTWPSRINGLMQAAARLPERFPDGPLPTLVNEVSYLVGVPIDFYARIDIGGFTQLIDTVGGVDVVLEDEIDDPTYQFLPTEVGFHLLPGPHHLDGKLATAYARSRHGRGNSDFQRARRQQQILLALRDRVHDPLVLANLPGLLDAVSQIVRTDAPLDRLPEIVQIVQNSTGSDTRHIVLGPNKYAEPVFTPDGDRTFAYQLKLDAVGALSIELFGDLSRYAHLPP